MNYNELTPWPNKLPKGVMLHLIGLYTKRIQVDPVKDCLLVWNVLGYAAGKTASRVAVLPDGKIELHGFAIADDHSNSDLVACMNRYVPRKETIRGKDGKVESVEVEEEPNWGVLATVCKQLLNRLGGGNR